MCKYKELIKLKRETVKCNRVSRAKKQIKNDHYSIYYTTQNSTALVTCCLCPFPFFRFILSCRLPVLFCPFVLKCFLYIPFLSICLICIVFLSSFPSVCFSHWNELGVSHVLIPCWSLTPLYRLHVPTLSWSQRFSPEASSILTGALVVPSRYDTQVWYS